MNVEDENYSSVQRVYETPQNQNLCRMNDNVEGNTENIANPNGLLHTDFRRVQMEFRHQIDSLKAPHMCHVCQESYLFMKVTHNSKSPICNRCRQERSIHRFSDLNHMDHGSQP